MDRWEGKHGHPPRRQEPLQWFERHDLWPAKWLYQNDEETAALAARIHAFDNEVEIIFDKSTTTPGTDEPGFHVVRITGPHSLRRLFSCTVEESELVGQGFGGTRVRWMRATAKAPGDWVLARLRDLDKRSLPGDEAHIDQACGDAVMANVEANDKAKDAQFQAEDEAAADVMLTGANNSKHHKPRPKPGPPIQVSMRAKSPILRGAFLDGKPVIVE